MTNRKIFFSRNFFAKKIPYIYIYNTEFRRLNIQRPIRVNRNFTKNEKSAFFVIFVIFDDFFVLFFCMSLLPHLSGYLFMLKMSEFFLCAFFVNMLFLTNYQNWMGRGPMWRILGVFFEHHFFLSPFLNARDVIFACLCVCKNNMNASAQIFVLCKNRYI